MKKIGTILILLIYGSVIMVAQSQKEYGRKWKTVNKHMENGLPKSALNEVESIMNLAIKYNNEVQKVKAIVHRTGLILNSEELGLEKVIDDLDGYIKETKEPSKSLLKSYAAELISNYFNQNLYEIQQRTDLDQPTSDIRTWSPNNFRSYISTMYLASLDADTRIYPTSSYLELLKNSKEANIGLKPTLYDLLLTRAMGYFNNTYLEGDKGMRRFYVDDQSYFEDYRSFADMQMGSYPSIDMNAQVMNLYIDILKHHRDKESIALAQYDVNRLDFVRRNYIKEADRDSLYIQALSKALQSSKEQGTREIYLRKVIDYHMGKNEYKTVLQLTEEYKSTSSTPMKKYMDQVYDRIWMPHLYGEVKEVYPSKGRHTAKLHTKNIKSIKADLIPVDFSVWETMHKTDDRSKYLRKRKPAKSWIVDVSNETYESKTMNLELPNVPKGYYVLRLNDDKKASSIATYWVSDLAYAVINQSEDSQIVVVDRDSGAPIPGATVNVYRKEYHHRSYSRQDIGSFRTDADGSVLYSHQGNRGAQFEVEHKNDFLNLNTSLYGSGRYHDPGRTTYQYFTDRSIYRPGQNLHVKLLAMKYDENGVPSIHTDLKEDVLILRDANGQVVVEQLVSFNELGAGSTRIVLPKGLLNGYFSLSTKKVNSHHSFRVEEYKRPTFDIEIDTVKEEVSLNKEIHIRGKSMYLSGVPTQGAHVAYKIVRRTQYGWGCYWSYFRAPTEDMIAQGETTTEKDGSFDIPFTAITDGQEGLFTFSAEITITEPNGETQTATWSLSLSDRPYNLSITGPERINKDIKDLLYVEAKNAQGVANEAEVNVLIYRKKEVDKDAKDSDLKGKVVKRIPMVVKGKTPLDLSDLPFGEYIVQINSKEIFDGNPISYEKNVRIYSFDNGQFPSTSGIYIDKERIQGTIGKPFSIRFGTSDPTIHVYTKVVRKDKVLAQEWIRVDNVNTLTYTPNESDLGGVDVLWMYVKNNTFHQGVVTVDIPWKHKELDLKLITARDITKPGSKESWKLQVSPWDGIHAGEVIATMYDASLDQLVKHSFNLQGYPINRSLVYLNGMGFRHTGFQNLIHFDRDHSTQIKWNLTPPELIEMYQAYYGGRIMYRSYVEKSSAPMMMESASMDQSDNVMVVQSKKGAGAELQESMNDVDDTSSQNKDASIRENLDELVFFYPHLPVEKDGTVDIDFTMNDALTEWKMLVFAHDAAYRYGIVEHTVKTQKELMVLPNASRFIREGDVLNLPVTIYNLSKKDVKADVGLHVIDPATGSNINDQFSVDKPSQVVVPADGSITVYYTVRVPYNYKNDIGYTFWAETEKHKDAQSGSLPILTSDVLLTETKIVDVAPRSEVLIDDSWMKNKRSADPHRLIIEYTSNPIWYVVKALPALAPTDGAERSASEHINALYAHALARLIAKQNPRIKQVVQQWKLEGNVKGNLESRANLNNTSLSATPWVREAKRETKQRESLIQLFDENASAYRQSALVRGLLELQNSDGGISWYSGSRSSIYMTQYVIEYVAKLKHMSVELDGLDHFTDKALQYMKRELEYRYSKINRKGNDVTDNHLDALSIQYMYICSFEHKSRIKESKASRYYLDQMEKYWNKKGLMEKAMIATTLYRIGNNDYREIVQSISEHSFYNEALGRYWNTGNGYKWYDLPIETHANIMELYSEIGESKDAFDMTKWLLKNKEASEWNTDQGTAAACYAVLMGVSRSALDKTVLPSIQVNGKELDTESLEAGSGYIRIIYDAVDLKNSDIRTIRITNNGDQVGWVAIYYQYHQDLRDVASPVSNPLKVKKTLYKEITDEVSTRLVKLEEGMSWENGDRLVSRIEIKTDRAMDYVQIEDMRPSGVEPESKLSGYSWSSGLGYHQDIRDQASFFYIEHLPKGTYVLQSENRVVHKGKYTSGVVKIQNMYAPKYTSYSNGELIYVK